MDDEHDDADGKKDPPDVLERCGQFEEPGQAQQDADHEKDDAPTDQAHAFANERGGQVASRSGICTGPARSETLETERGGHRNPHGPKPEWPPVEPGWIILALMAGLALTLIAWGLLNDPQPTPEAPSKQRRLQAQDGTWVASHGERLIANYLSAHNIPYRYEPEMADGLTPDFHIENTNTIIEYWGLASQPTYEARMIEKLEQYEHHDLDVISLFPANVHEMETRLEEELTKRGLPHDEPPAP